MDDTRRQNDNTSLKDEEVTADSVQEEQSLEEENNTVGEELERLQSLTEQLDNQLKRSLADYQNLQRRVQEEKKEWATFAKGQAVLKFLPILDTLMLAQKHTQDKNFVLTVQQFLQVLNDEGFERIKTVGEQFEPNTMEATGTTDGKENEVLEEVRAGFKYNDTVLRPAQVIVGAV